MKITINKAIEILTNMRTPEYRGSTEKILAALQLGVEALNAWRERRLYSNRVDRDLLPSETEEKEGGLKC